MPLVLSTHPLHPRVTSRIEIVAALRTATSLAPETLIKEASDADIIIVRAPLPPELFAHAPRLRAAIRHGAGVDMIPIDVATAAGVLVVNVPGANAASVSEYVIFSALALARQLRMVDRDLRKKGWHEARDHAIAGTEIAGKTVGLVGMGKVGKEIARLARAFGMPVVAVRRSAGAMPSGVTAESLETVVAKADFLVLCCPLTQDTSGLIDKTRLRLMKRSAFLINAARGPIVVEADLLEALETGIIAGAALDVFAQQPLASDHPLLKQDNVLVTPHLAGITDESMERMGIGAISEALRVLKGQLPENLVNPDAIPTYRKRFPSR